MAMCTLMMLLINLKLTQRRLALGVGFAREMVNVEIILFALILLIITQLINGVCTGIIFFRDICIGCHFEPLLTTDCPDNFNLGECTNDMNTGDLCEADSILPDGNTDYNINNCGHYEVFKCKRGTHSFVFFQNFIL